MDSDVSAAVLAGGQSSRFGSQKMLVRIGSETLLDRAVDLAKSISERVLLVLSSRDQLPFDRDDVTVLADEVVDCGPLMGIGTALSACSSRYLAVLPADLPLLSPVVYDTLLSHCSQDTVVIARSHSGIEPLVSIWPKSTQRMLKDELRMGRYSPLDFFKKATTVFVDISRLSAYRKTWFMNINTPDDLAKLRRSTVIDEAT